MTGERVRCPGCYRWPLVTRDGCFRAHTTTTGGPACSWSGRPATLQGESPLPGLEGDPGDVVRVAPGGYESRPA